MRRYEFIRIIGIVNPAASFEQFRTPDGMIRVPLLRRRDDDEIVLTVCHRAAARRILRQ
jgi:hypothetical protein